MLSRRLACVLSAVLLTGCITFPRAPAPPPWPSASASPPGFSQIRQRDTDPHILETLQREIVRARDGADGTVSVLALSGGGAEGAFGAGVLAGWTRTGQRPEFQVVTGVSTGALIAPFALLGPKWDGRLREAFAGEKASGLLAPAGLGILFGPSIYRGRPLEKLVDSFVTEELIAAVAREHARGRRLLVATTDLDQQQAVVWNLGAVATHGGPEARRLFRDILVASASIPGVFPPKLIAVEAGGRKFAEMHVDGGVATPFFSVPPTALYWTAPGGLLQKARLYVIVNGRIRALAQTTSVNTLAVLARAFDTVELTAAHSTLGDTMAFCARNGIEFHAAAMSAAVKSDGPFEFKRSNRQRLFVQGERLGASGEAWTAWKAETPLADGLR